MDTTVGILVISDMHITDTLYGRGAGQSMFVKDVTFRNNFFYSLKDELKDHNVTLKYILVLGDSADFALGSEYTKASDILSKMCKQFSVKKENVLIIPGNHDMSREKLRFYCYENNIKRDDIIKYQSIKFEEFTKFYNNFYDNPKIVFDPDKAITRVLYAKELETVFVGINSVFKDSFLKEDHCGWINYTELDNEMESVRSKYPDKKIIALMHHTPQPIGDDNRSIKNWSDVIGIFDRDNVTAFMSGHAHTVDGHIHKTVTERTYLTIGSLSASEEGVNSSYVFLKHCENEKGPALRVFVCNYEADYNPADKYWQNQTKKKNIMQYIQLS